VERLLLYALVWIGIENEIHVRVLQDTVPSMND